MTRSEGDLPNPPLFDDKKAGGPAGVPPGGSGRQPCRGTRSRTTSVLLTLEAAGQATSLEGSADVGGIPSGVSEVQRGTDLAHTVRWATLESLDRRLPLL
jgi:hypothetical protein